MQASDVKQIKGVATLGINEEGRRRLRIQMLRVILLHSQILRLGLQDLVKNCIKRGSEGFCLFPKIVSVSDHHSELFSKRLARFFHLLAITDKRVIFDCFRHWCKQSLENNECRSEIINQFLGSSRAQNGSAIYRAECKTKYYQRPKN
jgi:hypothetical protein